MTESIHAKDNYSYDLSCRAYVYKIYNNVFIFNIEKHVNLVICENDRSIEITQNEQQREKEIKTNKQTKKTEVSFRDL